MTSSGEEQTSQQRQVRGVEKRQKQQWCLSFDSSPPVCWLSRREGVQLLDRTDNAQGITEAEWWELRSRWKPLSCWDMQHQDCSLMLITETVTLKDFIVGLYIQQYEEAKTRGEIAVIGELGAKMWPKSKFKIQDSGKKVPVLVFVFTFITLDGHEQKCSFSRL